jgi:hypothetical protein
MKNETYWAGIEYDYLEEHMQYSKLKGGFVYVFLSAKDVRDLIEVVENEFKRKKLSIVRVEFVNIYDRETKWKNAEDQKRYKQIVKEAELTKKVVFDDFYSYEIDH